MLRICQTYVFMSISLRINKSKDQVKAFRDEEVTLQNI